MKNLSKILREKKEKEEEEVLAELERRRIRNKNKIAEIKIKIADIKTEICNLNKPFVFSYSHDLTDASRYFEIREKLILLKKEMIEEKKHMVSFISIIFVKLSMTLLIVLFTFRASTSNPEFFESIVFLPLLSFFFENEMMLRMDFIILEFFAIASISFLIALGFYKQRFIRKNVVKSISLTIFLITMISMSVLSFFS